MFQEVLEQQSDDGLDDELAEQATAMMHYTEALNNVSFIESSESDGGLAERMRDMPYDSDSEQGGDSDAESYGKVESEPAPYRV